MAEQFLELPIHSSEEAGIVADISAAKLGEDSLVIEQLKSLQGHEFVDPEILTIEGEAAELVWSALTGALADYNAPEYPAVKHVVFKKKDLEALQAA